MQHNMITSVVWSAVDEVTITHILAHSKWFEAMLLQEDLEEVVSFIM